MDTKESIQELFRSFKNFEDRNEFSTTFNIDARTFARWQREKFTGKGLYLIRARVALQYVGYTLTDARLSDPVFVELCEAVTFSILTIQDIRLTLGLKDDKDIYRLLLQESKTSHYRLENARSLVTKIQGELSCQRQKAHEALLKMPYVFAGKHLTENNNSSKVARTPSLRATHEDLRLNFENEPQFFTPEMPVSNEFRINYQETVLSSEMLEIFGGLVIALRPILEYFNNADPEVRKELRKHIGYAEMSQISELFREVASEKYRQTQSIRKRG